ncbi:nucleotide exchange factor GrpE [Fructilactobacillus lindneri]|nr:nucleotide exchange factor GrpE [Fructilactobacillus lindneri]ANZ58112.1 nucleotide exchange factor GrpE [Fructilactobacillus lindneri]ANZ59433.1 nucleotide exchange factor GrpE [Fructilactobacillus lindneri]POG98783.1 nucleotide exchange factor GrpE [Fructilactobacillus lindneri]POH03056.1 nucleotide exchange factor GrpE [Fructilactobacillus lindneri]POH04171.1 nucleotide exchange factor GrpE [Fructilactobacillus lindneri]
MADKHSDKKENIKEDQEAVTEKDEDTAVEDDEVVTLKKQLDEAQNDYLRAQAEIQNMQKSNQKEQSNLVKFGAQGLAKDIIPAMDDLKRALEVEVDDESGQQLKSGIEMVYKHLKKALTDNNINEIDDANVEFNPELHQAVQTVAASDEHPSGTVVQVLQTGYELAGRVIRPAMVVVAQ